MTGADADTKQSELVYLPEPSWYPPLFAAGLGGVVASIFTWWPYGVIGAIVAIVALAGMVANARADYRRLPRRQRITPGSIPPSTLNR